MIRLGCPLRIKVFETLSVNFLPFFYLNLRKLIKVENLRCVELKWNPPNNCLNEI